MLLEMIWKLMCFFFHFLDLFSTSLYFAMCNEWGVKPSSVSSQTFEKNVRNKMNAVKIKVQFRVQFILIIPKIFYRKSLANYTL